MAGSSQTVKVSRLAWGLVVAGGLLTLVMGAGGLLPGDTIMFTGDASNRSIYPPQAQSDLIIAGRVASLFLLMVALLQIAIGSKAFRRGEKWAWYAVAIFPILMVLNSYFDYVGAGPGFVYTAGVFPIYVFGSYIFAAPSLLGLLISIRSFFPKGVHEL